MKIVSIVNQNHGPLKDLEVMEIVSPFYPIKRFLKNKKIPRAETGKSSHPLRKKPWKNVPRRNPEEVNLLEK